MVHVGFVRPKFGLKRLLDIHQQWLTSAVYYGFDNMHKMAEPSPEHIENFRAERDNAGRLYTCVACPPLSLGEPNSMLQAHRQAACKALMVAARLGVDTLEVPVGSGQLDVFVESVLHMRQTLPKAPRILLRTNAPVQGALGAHVATVKALAEELGLGVALADMDLGADGLEELLPLVETVHFNMSNGMQQWFAAPRSTLRALWIPYSQNAELNARYLREILPLASKMS